MNLTRAMACKMVMWALRSTELSGVIELMIGRVIEPNPAETEASAADREAVADILDAMAAALRS